MPGRARRNSARIMFSQTPAEGAVHVGGGKIQRKGGGAQSKFEEAGGASQAAMRRCLNRVSVVACTAAVRRIRDFGHVLAAEQGSTSKNGSSETLGLFMRQVEVRIGMSCCERFFQSRRIRECRCAWQIWNREVADQSKYGEGDICLIHRRMTFVRLCSDC